MPTNNSKKYSRELLTTYKKAQASIPSRYDTNDYFGQCALTVEEQSASFLKDYITGEISVSENANDVLEEYLHILSFSAYPPIKKNLKKAKDKYKAAVIAKRKETERLAAETGRIAEKKKQFRASNFGILNNKKRMAQLSSEDLLIMAEMLEEEKGFSTTKLKDKIRSYCQNRIEQVFRGEVETDEKFDQLVSQMGTFQQKNRENKRRTSNRNKNFEKELDAIVKDDKSKEQKKKQEKRKNKEKSGLFRKLWRKARNAAIAVGVTALALCGAKFAQSQFSKDSSDNRKQNPTEQVVKTPETVQSAKQKQQTEQNVSNQKDIEFNEAYQALQTHYKNRFDSSLKILLGEEERDKLYSVVDKLEKEGKIAYLDGTTREWYAHAFTMYSKVAPQSAEYGMIKDLLKGKEVDKNTLNNLVMAAGRDGSGIKGTGTYSAFDNASKEDQQTHIQNRKKVKDAEKVLKQVKLKQGR